jgi:hypothetical protein
MYDCLDDTAEVITANKIETKLYDVCRVWLEITDVSDKLDGKLFVVALGVSGKSNAHGTG